jgi:hypothetical protein
LEHDVRQLSAVPPRGQRHEPRYALERNRKSLLLPQGLDETISKKDKDGKIFTLLTHIATKLARSKT